MITQEEINDAVRSVYTTETLTDTQVLLYTRAAARYYSKYNPLIVTAAMPVFVGQTDYALPQAAVGVVSVDYFPGVLPYDMTAGNFDGATLALTTRPDLALTGMNLVMAQADRVIKGIAQGEAIKRWRGIFETRRTSQGLVLVLWPAPEADRDVLYQYTVLHTYAVDETWPTIPADDLEIVRDLVVAEILGKWLNDYATEPDVAEGLGKVTKGHLPVTLQKRISGLRAPVRQLYGRPPCAVS